MATSVSKLKLPQRPPRYRFALTPLADAMFQLLIFFMLSSSLTPYSLITLRTSTQVAVAGDDADAADPAPAQATDSAPEIVSRDAALWIIDFGAVIVQNNVFDPDDLPDLAAALGSEEAPADVVLIVRETATVQDISWVMEVLQTANIGSVRVTRDGEGA